eukprot:3095692-Rhodomonas_salina.1
MGRLSWRTTQQWRDKPVEGRQMAAKGQVLTIWTTQGQRPMATTAWTSAGQDFQAAQAEASGASGASGASSYQQSMPQQQPTAQPPTHYSNTVCYANDEGCYDEHRQWLNSHDWD